MKIEDYSKYYIQGSDHYLIPKDEFKELFNEMINWKEESQKLQTTVNNCKRLKEEYNKIQKAYESTFSDYQELKGNWNKLKEYIKETKLKEFEKSYGKRYGKTFTQAEIIVCNMILDKMQELERGVSDVED